MRRRIVHVNQCKIKANIKNKTDEPCITVKDYKSNFYGKNVKIKDKEGNVLVEFKQQLEHPLSCGARVWAEVYTDNIEVST